MRLNDTEFIIEEDAPAIVMSRELDAPREVVFRALTEAPLIERWYGPRRFTVTAETDPRVGGRYRIVNRSESGAEFVYRGVLKEFDPPRRAVQTWVYEGAPEIEALETVELDDLGGRTGYHSRTLFPDFESREPMIGVAELEGAAESMDRLVELLGALKPVTGEATITRSIGAAPERVWEAWTRPELFAQWFGTPPFETPVELVSLDVRPGGEWSATQVSRPDDFAMRFVGRYREVVEPVRLVYAMENPEDRDDPNTEMVTVTLRPTPKGTDLTLHQVGHLPAEQYPLLEAGYSAFFGRMAALLER